MRSVVVTIAKNTFLEMIRDRVLYFVVIFSVLFMGLCFALGQLSYDEIFRLSVSLGLGGIHMCFMGLTIFLGCSVFFREIEHKTIYTLIARPVSRWQYLLGKYFGLVLVLTTLLFGFLICFTFIEVLLGMPVLVTSYYSFFGFFLESLVLLALSFLFSTFAKPFLAVSAALSFFLVGHWVGQWQSIVEKGATPLFQLFSVVLVHCIPDLELVNWRSFAIAKANVPIYELVFSSLYMILWAAFLFLSAILVFRSKDFE